MAEGDFNVFYCTVCHFCKKIPIGPEEIKFCSGCRLVQYCSHTHQKIDWPNHKELCQVVQHIVKRTGGDHLFKEAYEFTTDDLSSWNKLRVSVMKLVELTVKRSLIPVESQIFLFPPVCHYCFRYKINTMFPCSSCNSVIYCCLEHKLSDEKHKINCKQLSLSFNLDMLHFCKRTMISNLSIINDFNCLRKLPENMESLSRLVQGKSANEFAHFSEILSYTLTLVFAIQKVEKVACSTLAIHMVGADAMEISAVDTFTLFSYLLPHVSHIAVIMIGPNISNVPVTSVISKNCEVIQVNKLYHEYADSGCYIHPDVIAVFNCGFCEHVGVPEKDTWKMSLSCIVNTMNCSVVLTSYTSYEANEDLKRLCEMRTRQQPVEKVLECQENSFSSLYPHRDWENHGCVFYINKYISILNIYV